MSFLNPTDSNLLTNCKFNWLFVVMNDEKVPVTHQQVNEMTKVDFDDLVDLKNEKEQMSNYDVDSVAKYHWKKVKQWR